MNKEVLSITVSWAHVSAAAHSFHKSVITQGSINVPLIISHSRSCQKENSLSFQVCRSPTFWLANILTGNSFNGNAIMAWMALYLAFSARQ